MINMKTYEVTVDDKGTIRWTMNGNLHREDGPATEYSSGKKQWYLNGKLHREDGPAIEWKDGAKCWYLDGLRLTEEEFNNRHRPFVGTTITINGIKYTLA